MTEKPQWKKKLKKNVVILNVLYLCLEYRGRVMQEMLDCVYQKTANNDTVNVQNVPRLALISY